MRCWPQMVQAVKLKVGLKKVAQGSPADDPSYTTFDLDPQEVIRTEDISDLTLSWYLRPDEQSSKAGYFYQKLITSNRSHRSSSLGIQRRP